MKSESEQHPVLFSEAAWNQKARREKIVEIMFEKYNSPAFFMAKSPVLAAFANGRSTGIVVDSGATHTTAVPVHDGYCLQQAIVKSPLAGDFIVNQCRQFLEEQKVDIVPAYMIAGKEEVNTAAEAKWTKKPKFPEVTTSSHKYMQREVVSDFAHSILQVSDLPYDEESIATIPHVGFEFPNGYNDEYGPERFKIPEALFEPARHLRSPHAGAMLGAAHVVTTAVALRFRHRHRRQHASSRFQRAFESRFGGQDAHQHALQVNRGQRRSRTALRLLDRRLHLGLVGLLSTDVDFEAGIRRERKISGGQKMSLSCIN